MPPTNKEVSKLADSVNTLSSEVKNLKNRINTLVDELHVTKNELNTFKKNVAQDVTYLTEKVDGE